MGVDISTYRCRVGRFVPHHGTGVICSPISFSQLITIIGAVSFVRLLLVMAGIEENPGPPYIFRYQYLLVKLGTDVLRRVFDVVVGNNVVQYLNAKSQDIQNLIKARMITADQKQLLPPINSQPDSSKFDITLLSCLLRNICGLRQPKDSVWIQPAITDTSVEADITRLRMCRIQLTHSDQLVLPEADFNSKWQDLSVILHRLNNVGGIAQLQSDINNAEIMEIDEQLREQLDKTLQEWSESDRLLGKRIDEVLSEVGNVKQDLVAVKRKLEDVELLQQKKVDNTGLKQHLVDLYQRNFSALAVSPLLAKLDVDLLSFYSFPTLNSVSYHVNPEKVMNKHIASYCDIFYNEGHPFRNIFITGDAGTGKTTLCRHMCLLWSKFQNGDVIESAQTDIKFLAEFDFLFYLELRESHCKDVVTMIVDQLYHLYKDGNTMYKLLDNQLRQRHCLVILDGLDEWSPAMKISKPELPSRVMHEECIYLTTSRPYKIENMGLTPKEIDRQIQITGLHGSASASYVEGIVNYLNKENCENKKPDDFLREVKQCGFEDQLCIPMIASQLVVVWFEKELTDMSRALIYGSVVDMLFGRTEMRGVEFPPATNSELPLLGSLSELCHLNKHAALLQKVCLLSFRSLFKQDENSATLIFTRQQLNAEPYFLFDFEIDLLCKIGILSKNKVVGRFLTQKQKISFLHKAHLEFFAALFVASFDRNNCFVDIIMKWTSINDVLQYETFFLMLAGLISQKIRFLFENIYSRISDDLRLCRINAIFHHDSESYSMQIKALQDIVINCVKEVSRSQDPNIVLKLEDFIFDDDYKVDILKQLLLLNTTCVKSIYSVMGKYYDEFDQISNLQCLHVGEVLSGDYVKFTMCMLQNQSTLHTVCIEGCDTLIPELPVRHLQNLTSLSLSEVTMPHKSLHNLVTFLSDNVLIENIKLSYVRCDNHPWYGDSACTLTLKLPHHVKLTSLCLVGVNMVCHNVNNSSLKYITLHPLSERVVRCYMDVFYCIKYSQLEHLDIGGFYMLDYNALRTLKDVVNTLPYIKVLRLWSMKLPDDVLLQLHPDVTQVKIELHHVTMSCQCFHCFIVSSVNDRSVIKVELYRCNISSVDGETHRELSWEKSIEYMSEYLTSIPTVNITRKDIMAFHFDTGGCQ